MSIRNLGEQEYLDRMEWLSGAAGRELAATDDLGGGEDRDVIAVLDRIKQAAEQCAKYRRDRWYDD